MTANEQLLADLRRELNGGLSDDELARELMIEWLDFPKWDDMYHDAKLQEEKERLYEWR